MKTKAVLCVAAALVLAAGCVPALNPVYTDKDLVFDASLLGVWKDRDGQGKWEFKKRGEKEYRLVFTDKQGRQGSFIARLAAIEDALFLDLYPEATKDRTPGFYKFHLLPIHTVYLVEKGNGGVTISAFDLGWLNEHLAGNPHEIPFVTFNGRKLITATTARLQQFVLKHRDRFRHDVHLTRAEQSDESD